MAAVVTDSRVPRDEEDVHDEREPLLPAGSVSPTTTKPSRYHDDPTGTHPEHTDALTEEEEIIRAAAKVEKTKWTAWSIGFYVVLALMVIFLIIIIVLGSLKKPDPGDDDDDVEFDAGKALKAALMKALGGGLSGAAAMVIQVLTLMPIRTIINYQYRYGTSTITAAKTLYASGGYPRYYSGLPAALIQGPISRFWDTAANAGVLALLGSNYYMKRLPELVKTIFASGIAAALRMVTTPIDTVKTTLQTQGKPGMRILKARVKMYGIGSLWYGAFATAAATFVGHYPWFGTYNYLQKALPPADHGFPGLARQAFIGFAASVISDTVSNSVRVVKTYRQVNETRIGYIDAARAVIAVDGWWGLFGRGLITKWIANGLQGIMFSVLWKFFMDLWSDKTN